MATQLDAEQKPLRRWFALRFSLRIFLLLFTVACIGAGVWWRWPITQTTVKGQQRETYTYHRGWNGELIKHGRHSSFRGDVLGLEENYLEGVLHGPFRRPGVQGEYYLGKKHGRWEYALPA